MYLVSVGVRDSDISLDVRYWIRHLHQPVADLVSTPKLVYSSCCCCQLDMSSLLPFQLANRISYIALVSVFSRNTIATQSTPSAIYLLIQSSTNDPKQNVGGQQGLKKESLTNDGS